MVEDRGLEMRLERELPGVSEYSITRKNGVRLGTIKWLDKWGCYRFYPEFGIVSDQESIEDIQKFIDSLTRGRENWCRTSSSSNI